MPRTTDVVVIGAGLVGAVTALRLAQAGRRVTILDRSAPNTQGSAATAGNLHIQTIHTRRPGQDVPVDVRRLVPFQKEASRLWDELAENVGPDLGLVRCGGFMVAETDAQVAALREKHGWEAAAGIASEVVDGETARRELPLLGRTVRAATWCGLDGYAEPHLAAPAVLSAAVAAGAELHPYTRVTGIERVADTWLVSSGFESWSAPSVVNAAGPWMAEVARLAGAEVNVRPAALQMHSTTAAPGTLPYLVQHVAEGISVKQDRRDRIVIGGGWPGGSFDPERPAPVNAASITGNLAQVSRLLPALAEHPIGAAWTGPVITTSDEMPIIGELDCAPGMFVAGGTYSFTFAPVWADVLGALVCGEEPALDVTEFGPGRLTAASRADRLQGEPL
ncbi:FAD-binding oxidoreductase [Nocardia sp. BMG51109]|uniref:NAD(P)/FAD-dependent oxidoreductase n=1 Tax=Nocardia sp. BMG51109 TaxID=1056816 RepID=UPI0004637056|nr:FAD-dependent oxidoreductase [Nocardia sp. BMG51109]